MRALLVAAVPFVLSAQASPSIVVAVPSATVAELDTIAGVAGTPLAAGGRRSGTTTVVWSTSPSGIVRVIPRDKHAQVVSLAGVAPGSTYVVASWRRSKTVTLRDSQPIVVLPPRVVWIGPANVRTDSGPVFDIAIPFACLTPIAFDRAWRPILGLPVSWSTSDVVSAWQLNSSRCANRTIDPSTLPLRP